MIFIAPKSKKCNVKLSAKSRYTIFQVVNNEAATGVHAFSDLTNEM